MFRILKGSHAFEIAVDSEGDKVVGFINAILDGVLSAYIPLLEVLPGHQGRGIGKELTARMLGRLEGLYMVDVVCDRKLEAFYAQAGFAPLFAMVRRNYAAQSGRENT